MGGEVTRRILPPSEYHRLVGTELETIAPHLPPHAQVLVVEDATGAIVGSWAGFFLFHAEGIHIAPTHQRRAAVARHLWKGMREIAKSLGVQAINTAAASAEVSALLHKHGAPVGGEHFSLRVQ